MTEQQKKHIENVDRINCEIINHNAAYKIQDRDGNIFVYSRIENGYPVYRTNRGCKHIFSLNGFKVLEKQLQY